MAYVLLDDQIATHPKVLKAGAEAAWLWACAIAYCNRQLTDGLVPAEALPTMGTFKTAPAKLAARLVAVGLFEEAGDGYRVHDYLTHNPDKATVQARRAASSARQAAHRSRPSHGEVTHMSQRDTGVTSPSVTHLSQCDTDVTAASSRGRVPTPTPLPTPTATATESVAVDAHAPEPSRGETWGPSPAQRWAPGDAFRSQNGVHVPGFLHGQFSDRLRSAGDADPDATLQAWYRAIDAEWAAKRLVIGEKAPKFWETRFEETHGCTPRAPSRPFEVPFDAEAAVAAQLAIKAARRRA